MKKHVTNIGGHNVKFRIGRENMLSVRDEFHIKRDIDGNVSSFMGWYDVDKKTMRKALIDVQECKSMFPRENYIRLINKIKLALTLINKWRLS